MANAHFVIILQGSVCSIAARREHVGGMLLRLIPSMRIRVGRLIALAYLFCVLAPAASLAWGQAPAPCLGDDFVPVNVMPAHHQTQTSHEIQTSHAHGDSSHDHAGAHAHHQTAAQDAPAPHRHDGKGTPGPCCGMMCVSALPADLPSVAKPLQPVSACSPEIVVSLHSAAPPLLYRPPIA
ncbi:hypothetical protein [Bradyrhizobium sp. 149]|uniref:hypothetical protein n=1 Tax=Bradyrhizobium sp. 149 TaxID=2782624 RepID=UPI001FF73F52|nr:hypothetical protein [Bradyrhizobium sp. 149]